MEFVETYKEDTDHKLLTNPIKFKVSLFKEIIQEKIFNPLASFR